MTRVKRDTPLAAVFAARFDPRAYIINYYPEFGNVGQLAGLAKNLRSSRSDKCCVDEIAFETGVTPETIENLTLMEFQREAIEQLLPIYPRGNARVLDVGGGPTIYQHLVMWI